MFNDVFLDGKFIKKTAATSILCPLYAVNLFKGIFIRYFTQLIMHPDLPSDKREKYIRFIEYNAKVLLTYASDDKNTLLFNYGWYFKPKNSFLRGQTSGCTLIEADALLEKKGFL